jgi:hypothetical protein
MATWGNKILGVRLVPELRASVEQMAKCYGDTPSGFVRDMLAAVCSGDLHRLGEFQTRLQRGFIEQMSLALPEDKVGTFRQRFTADVGKAVQMAGKQAVRASKQPVRGRKGGRVRARP